MDHKAKLLMAVLALTLGVGCAKESSNSPSNGPAVNCLATGDCTTGPTPPPVAATPHPDYTSGSSAVLDLSGGASKLAQMFYNSNPNDPQDVRINIDLERQTDSVIISFKENGTVYEAAMGITHPYSGHTNNQFNGWVDQGGNMVWKGFFQDTYGAIVVIIDKFITQGDGTVGNILGGEVWFQNFDRYYPNNPTQGPLKMCWEISLGPYDCRTFLVNKNVQMASSYYPNNRGPDASMSYVKLGTFNGINKEEAGFDDP